MQMVICKVVAQVASLPLLMAPAQISQIRRRAPDKIASTIVRVGQVRGLLCRPSSSAGRCAVITRHWASVGSLG